LIVRIDSKLVHSIDQLLLNAFELQNAKHQLHHATETQTAFHLSVWRT